MNLVRFINRNLSDGCFEVLSKSLAERMDDRGIAVSDSQADYTFSFGIDASLKDERYTVQKDGSVITVAGANESAVFAAAGAYMNASFFDGRGRFIPSENEIDFTPRNPLRGMYFASHFHNFYQNAPIGELYSVMEDLAFRGCNTLLLWFDMHHYTSMDDPGASFMVDRIKKLFTYAEKIGMGTALLTLSNEAFSTSPEALRAENIKQNAYHKRPEDHYGVEICPSKKGGMEEILKERREMLQVFKDVKVDYLVYWPYDQGGCTCRECQPWGSNGYLRILPEFRDLAKEIMPGSRLIVSTWYFDKFIDGEWEGFCRHLTAGDLGEFDYIMSFFRHGNIPECITEDIRKRYRFISFPEISMEGCQPWGGFGASTLLSSLQKTNETCRGIYAGGYPYSEGIFEDINKSVMLGWYTGRYMTSDEALKSYLSYEFCVHDEELDELSDAVYRLEKSLTKTKAFGPGEEPKFVVENPDDTASVAAVFEKYNEILPEKIRAGWKFRLLYLRAVIDRELVLTDGYPLRSEICENALYEVNSIYHADDDTEYQVRAPYGREPLACRSILCFDANY